ncbi:MAG TPA: transglutaminase family protein, partial [Polyangiaceae bacterium]
MAIRVALQHQTRYEYDRPVQLSPHVVRLRPAPHSRTSIQSYSLTVSPSKHFINWQQDPFGNHLARLVFLEPTKELVVRVDLVAELVTLNPFDFFLEPYAEKYPFKYEPALQRELLPYLEVAAGGPRLEALARGLTDSIARPGRRPVDVLVDINQVIQRSLHYDIRMDPGVYTPDETLERRHGSCRDFAWLMVNLLRHLGMAARFASGYSIQLKPDQKPLEGPSGVAQDCTDLHAWAEAYLPGAGWVGLDATSGLFCGEGHIPLACTAEPSSAAPISGDYAWTPRSKGDQLGQKFDFEMRVTRIEDRPRPTRSYSEEQWSAMVQCGENVDGALIARDVRLTMGGEPTFVSIDDMEGEEWNTAALGPAKARLAEALIRRLMRRFAPGALLHHGQGKWYPGEPLPRWAYSCYFRKDGEPLWRNPALFAETEASEQRKSEDALSLLQTVAEILGVDLRHIMPGYEDTWYYLWRERRLPINVDPLESHLD